MTKYDPAERLASAAERIAALLAEIVEMQRSATRTEAARAAGAPEAPLAGLAGPVAQLADAVARIATTNAQLAAERQQLRRMRAREVQALMEEMGRDGQVGRP